VQRIGNLIGQLLALGVVAAVGYFLYLLVSSTDQTRLAVLTAIVSVATLVYTQFLTSKREIAARQFAKKSEAYEEIIGTITSLMDANRRGEPIDDSVLMDRLAGFMPKMMIWGGTDVLQAWRVMATPNDLPMGSLMAGSSLITALRKELGHSNDSALGPFGALSAMIRHDEHGEIVMGE
jgi:hypothetical protein